MAIQSYFYDSVGGDRPYSASDFAKAFGMVFENGIMPNDGTSDLGFDIGGTNYNTIYEGKAVIQGRFVEVVGTEILTVPAGTYSGQIVIRVDMEDARLASIEVNTTTDPVQSSALYEFVLYDINVTDGIIGTVTDRRIQGGVLGQANVLHSHSISDITNLQTSLNAKADDSDTVVWQSDVNGVRCIMGKFAGTGKPVVLYLTSAQPAAVSTEHRVWIQIDKF